MFWVIVIAGVILSILMDPKGIRGGIKNLYDQNFKINNCSGIDTDSDTKNTDFTLDFEWQDWWGSTGFNDFDD